jgi:hypothetical protein
MRRNELALLPKLPLLITESADEFDALRDAFEREIKPRGIIEQMYVHDISSIVWEILRLRRCKVMIINAAFRSGLAHLLMQVFQFDLDESAIEAEAIRRSSADLELLGRMLSSLETRRNKALGCVAEYRASLADQLRESADRIVDGKSVLRIDDAASERPTAA